MPLDPELAELVTLANAAEPAHFDLHNLEKLRAQALAGSLAYGSGPQLRMVEDREIPGPRGQIPVRIYMPNTGPCGVVTFFHGSGFVIYNLDSHDRECRLLAAEASVIVVSVDYALAPEEVFPAAVDDCLAATRWVASHRAEIGATDLPLSVGGDSAGGNLAAVVSWILRSEPGVDISSQFLIYPVVDIAHESASYDENGKGYILTAEIMRFFIDCYAPRIEDRFDPRSSPLLAENLSDLPPTLVITAEYDPLRDEGEAYARALDAAGTKVELLRFDGAVHGFWQMTPVSSIARLAMARITQFLMETLKS